jgi:isopenicillin-N epimerase
MALGPDRLRFSLLRPRKRRTDSAAPGELGWHHDPARADEPDDFGSTPRLRSFEFEGTRDPCPWLTVPAAIDFQERLGWSNVRGRIAELVACTRKSLSGKLGLALATPAHPALHAAMTAVELPRTVNPQGLREQLWKRRIEVPIIERPERLLLRVSTHFYNTEEEIDRLTTALQELLH